MIVHVPGSLSESTGSAQQGLRDALGWTEVNREKISMTAAELAKSLAPNGTDSGIPQSSGTSQSPKSMTSSAVEVARLANQTTKAR
jgi:hypothetical protein